MRPPAVGIAAQQPDRGSDIPIDDLGVNDERGRPQRFHVGDPVRFGGSHFTSLRQAVRFFFASIDAELRTGSFAGKELAREVRIDRCG
jgi:hypothetical protein